MSALASAGRRFRLRRRSVRISRRRLRLIAVAAIALAVVAVGGWMLLRDSSFVSIDHVTITGAAGPDAAAISAALDLAAHRMTTLDFEAGRLRRAVSAFPEVKGLRISTRFPHGLVIHVVELLPVAVLRAPGREVVVGGDGTLLPNIPATGSLPVMTLGVAPIGGRLDQPWAIAAAQLLAAAPPRLLARLTTVMTVAGHGLVAQVRGGPSIYFSDASQAQAKWAAVVAVLADPGSAGASYIDVTDPARPVAGTDGTLANSGPGTISQAASNTGASTVTGASTSGATTAGTPAAAGTTSPSATPATTAAPPTTTTPTGG